jgi:ACT domain-containing protein
MLQRLRKYKIEEFLSSMGTKEKKSKISEAINKLGIKRSQFNKYRRCMIEDITAMNTDQIIKVSEVFGCTVDELLNKPQQECQAA